MHLMNVTILCTHVYMYSPYFNKKIYLLWDSWGTKGIHGRGSVLLSECTMFSKAMTEHVECVGEACKV